jgi:hypothetical protein
MTSSTEVQQSKISLGTLVVWVVSIVNLSLIWVSWTPWFGGTAQHAGMADKLFGQMRLAGFRADIVWLCVSTGVLFLVGWFFILQARTSRSARINAALCVAEVLSFALYVLHVLTSGVLDFG